jgi:hypothetical protein
MEPNVKIINQNDSRNTPRPTDSQQKNIDLLHVTHIIFMNGPIFLICCMLLHGFG